MSLGASSKTRSQSSSVSTVAALPTDRPSAAPSLASAFQSSGLGSQVSSSSPSLSAFEAEIVAVFADLVGLLGLPKSMGEIYGFVFASVEPPTFADIEQKLGLSKGSVSQGLRALRELGAVRDAGSEEQGAGEGKDETGNREPEEIQPAGPAGSSLPAPRSTLQPASPRATRWVATTELRQLIGTLLRERLTPYLGRQDQRMENAETALDAQAAQLPSKDYKALKARLYKLQTWQSRARTVLPVLGKML